jgi:AbiTii
MAPGSRRDEALRLSEELLSDIELGRIPATDIARKTSRLARLLDDAEALDWLRIEAGGYPPAMTGGLDAAATAAAVRSNRLALIDQEGAPSYYTASLSALQAEIDAAQAALVATGGAIAGEGAMGVEGARQRERTALRQSITRQTAIIQAVVGAFHDYVSSRYQELRFGSAVETAFGVVRADVDAAIASLVPDALPKLSAAFENSTSDNPEDWASAAATCRRLLKAAADALRPPGPDKDGHKMDDDHYINRLIDWINSQATSGTTAEMISADLAYLGRRLDASLGAGHKGAHAEVTRFDASRFVTGTYLLLGDILRLSSGTAT